MQSKTYPKHSKGIQNILEVVKKPSTSNTKAIQKYFFIPTHIYLDACYSETSLSPRHFYPGAFIPMQFYPKAFYPDALFIPLFFIPITKAFQRLFKRISKSISNAFQSNSKGKPYIPKVIQSIPKDIQTLQKLSESIQPAIQN